MEKRLERLYESLETAELELADLAPRIKEHRQRLELLTRAESEARQTLDVGHVELVDRKAVLSYLGELDELLNQGDTLEQKTLLRSFIKSVEIKDFAATIEYMLPLSVDWVDSTQGVLTIVQNGGPYVY